MGVVAHQKVGEQINRVALQPLGEYTLERLEIAVLVEQTHTPIPTIEDVIDHSCFDGSGRSRHGF